MTQRRRVVQEISEGRAIAFDSTRRKSHVDRIFVPVIDKVSASSKETGRELKARISEIRKAGSNGSAMKNKTPAESKSSASAVSSKRAGAAKTRARKRTGRASGSRKSQTKA